MSTASRLPLRIRSELFDALLRASTVLTISLRPATSRLAEVRATARAAARCFERCRDDCVEDHAGLECDARNSLAGRRGCPGRLAAKANEIEDVDVRVAELERTAGSARKSPKGSAILTWPSTKAVPDPSATPAQVSTASQLPTAPKQK